MHEHASYELLAFLLSQSITNATQSALQGNFPESKVHGANMGRIWGRQDLLFAMKQASS